MMDKPIARLLRVSEVAELWAVHRRTVYKYIHAGSLPAQRTGPHGCIRVPRQVAESFVVGVSDGANIDLE